MNKIVVDSKVLEQALSALELEATSQPLESTAAAMGALRAALEQPEQEPEWLTGCPSCGMDGGCDCDDGTYNPPRREWRGLTEEERNACLVDADPCECLADPEAHELMRSVETKLKELNA